MEPSQGNHPSIAIPNGQQQRPQYSSSQNHNVTNTPDRQHSNGIVSDYVLRSRYRIPTVEDALPFTPLTSVVPYSPDIIPFPSTAPPSRPNLSANTEDRRRAKGQLELLSREAAHPRRTSQLLGQSLKKLQDLLQPQEVTE
ncbi:hypothetical protein EJ08DRAFT_443725 [Tothia fuscella]|uniref:Uncharacterized protein n=1 Tax=Tothia fuscella TaxID=1048955 RepID=A0A9P4NJJ6_9PEZI|nr:hypothetical protein EJ08DRAFT_443725 [Tothia fuscella]